MREAQLSHGLPSVQAEFRASQEALHGLNDLRSVARPEEFALGRAIQRVLANRLLDRLKVCPAWAPACSRPVTGRARQEKTAIILAVLFPRSGMDELMTMLSLSYTPRATGRLPNRPLLSLHFPSASALLRALGVPMVLENMCRQFKRAGGSAPARVLLERVANDNGRM